ncbi:MAG: hypothetical protein P8H52_09360 [Porticoccaceae bacterium]|nr:hypothetical protein [Porticoccaceae bacterium]
MSGAHLIQILRVTDPVVNNPDNGRTVLVSDKLCRNRCRDSLLSNAAYLKTRAG